jgi:hypothetical protein
MRRGLFVLGLMTLGVGPLARCSADGVAPPRYTYGKVIMVDKTITTQQLEWRDEQVPRQVMKCTVEMRPIKHVVMVPTIVDTTRCVTDVVVTPREVCRDVKKCRLIPVLMYDNLTGKCFTGMRPEYDVVQVRTIVNDTKVVTRQVPDKVCKMVPQERVLEEPVLVPRPETVLQTRRVPVFVPVPQTIRVPQCVPSPVPVPPGAPPAPF